MDAKKNKFSFLSVDEQNEFNKLGRFFNREIRNEYSNDKNELVDLYGDLIKNNDSTFCGIWISGEKWDGISWLSEKILRTFQDKLYQLEKKIGAPELYILKSDKEIASSELPEICERDFIGKTRYINCAVKSGLIKKNLLLTVSKICTYIITVLGVVVGLPSLVGLLKSHPDSAWFLPALIIIGILSFIGVIHIFSESETKKGLASILDDIHNDTINKGKYEKLIELLAKKIGALSSPRVVIIDDFSALHKLSQDVLKKYYESKCEYQKDKEMWIVLNSNLAFDNQNKMWENKKETLPKFQHMKLMPLKLEEKKRLLEEHLKKLPPENSQREVVKDVCSEFALPISTGIIAEMEKLEKSDLNTFHFLYFIASNAVPLDMECRRWKLIDDILYAKNPQERNKYIAKVLKEQAVPSRSELEVYFNKITEFLSDGNEDIKGGKTFKVRYNVVRYIENQKGKPKAEIDLYCYSNSYWAMLWHSVIKKKQWKVNWILKFAHHLKAANGYCLNDNELRKNMLDIHLFGIEKSIKYFLRKEIIDIMENTFKLGFMEQNSNKEKRLETLATYIAYAFLEFDFLPQMEDLKKIGYEQFCDIFKKNNIKNAKSLLKIKEYKPLADVIIYVLIECYWEKTLFLHLSKKRNAMQYATAEADELKNIIKNHCIQNYLQDICKNNASQKIQNIALWIWINAFNISTIRFEKHEYDELIDHIEKLMHSFVIYSEQHIKYRDDIEQTMLYVIMQESAYIIISSTVIINASRIKYAKLEEYLKTIVDLYHFKIDVGDNKNVFNEVMKLMQLQSLMWRKGNYMNRYYTLNIIRAQLYSCWNESDAYTIEDEEKYGFKDEFGTVGNKHRLNAVANFTLCNLYFGYSNIISSHYFQQACDFLDSAKITKVQFEYIFICLTEYWFNGEKILEQSMDCLINNSEEYLEYILNYIANDVATNYLHLINTLNKFNDKRMIQFFAYILEQLKQRGTSDIEEAEAVWKNFEFEQMDEKEKIKNKKIYEDFWREKESLCYYSQALSNLLQLEQSDELKNKAFIFLTDDNQNYDEYSGHLMLACYYLEFCQDNKDEKYNEILGKIVKNEETTVYKGFLPLMKKVYTTLDSYTENPQYGIALDEINVKLTNYISVEVSTFDFLCRLCAVWFKRFYYEKNSQLNEVRKQDLASKKNWLDTYKHEQLPEIIVGGLINYDFLLINEIVNEMQYQNNDIIKDYKNFIDKCNEKAEENFDTVVEMIMLKNKNYAMFIQQLLERRNAQIVYTGDDDE